MSELHFLKCEAGAAEAARDWGLAALLRAGRAAAEAEDAAERLADGLRAAARALPCGPESMLALRARGGALEFELLADGVAPPPGFAVAMWPRVDRRVAGDGALRLAMPACAAPVPAE